MTWGWLAVVIALYSALLTDRGASRSYEPIQILIAWLLMGSMALTSSGSFRRERETGVMELLLVSPLREPQIIVGRLVGLWMQFLPAFCLLLGVWVYLAGLFPHETQGLALALFFSTFLSVPVIGLYVSLRSNTSFGAFLLTLGVGIAGPLVLAELLNYINALNMTGMAQPWEFRDSSKAAIVQLVVAIVCWIALEQRLKQRQFPLTVTSGV